VGVYSVGINILLVIQSRGLYVITEISLTCLFIDAITSLLINKSINSISKNAKCVAKQFLMFINKLTREAQRFAYF